MMKMKIRISLDRMRARVDSIQRRTQLLVSRLVPPAKARGANTAAMMMSSLRTMRAAQTMTTQISTRRAKRRVAAGLVKVAATPAPRRALPSWFMFWPSATWRTPLERASTASRSATVTEMAMVVPRKATTSPERALVMAAAVLADHGGDELDEEQGEGHEDGDAGHEAEVDPEGVGAGSGVEGHDRSP